MSSRGVSFGRWRPDVSALARDLPQRLPGSFLVLYLHFSWFVRRVTRDFVSQPFLSWSALLAPTDRAGVLGEQSVDGGPQRGLGHDRANGEKRWPTSPSLNRSEN
jgi:hypothetical protein